MSADNLIRIGRVSSVDAASGMMQVTYADRGGATTTMMPYFAFNDEYKMPTKEQMVLVLHFANGTAAGIVLGAFWNNANVPAETGEGLFLKQLGQTAGEAFIKALNGTITISGSSIVLSGSGEMSIDEIIAKFNDHESRITSLEAQI